MPQHARADIIDRLKERNWSVEIGKDDDSWVITVDIDTDRHLIAKHEWFKVAVGMITT
jgi:hypothetical protein